MRCTDNTAGGNFDGFRRDRRVREPEHTVSYVRTRVPAETGERREINPAAPPPRDYRPVLAATASINASILLCVSASL